MASKPTSTGIDMSITRIGFNQVRRLPNVHYEDGFDLIDGLVAFWELEEASGDRADSHGSNDLTDTNTVTQAVGKVGNAAQFTLANAEELQIADNADLSAGDIDFTVAAWAYLDTAGATTRSIITKWTTAGNQREYMLIYQSSRFHWLVSPVGSGAGAIDLLANTFGLPSTATWYFVVGWHDSVNNIVGISVNGTADTSSYSAGIFNGTSIFRLGNAGFGGGLMDGRIDQAGIWKKVLTSDERAFLYNSGNGRAYSEL